MSEIDPTTRRVFMKSAAATGLAALALKLPGCTAPSGRRWAMPAPRDITAAKRDKLRLAFIGTGGIGNYHMESTKELDIVCPCYCDVDTSHMKKAAEHFPQAKAYQDYRQMFDRERDNFDAVMIGTPDHHHFPATIWAMQLGKHVYTQKPLTHTVWEARQLAKAARDYKVVTQMGNQGHALEGWRLVYEFVHSGVLGDIVSTHTWTDRPIWPQGMLRPEETNPVPANLDWDVWLGPAPKVEFAKDAYHPFKWRGWWDYGAGALGDMACHTMDGIFWALDPGHPTSVEPITTTPPTNAAFPTASMIKWEFPRRGRRPAFVSYWYDGGLKPQRPPELEPERNLPATGNLFVGTKATMLISGDYGNSPRIIPEAKMREVGKPPKLLERSPGHVEEWIMACKGEQPIDYPKSRFAYSGPMSETILLGNVALRVGRRLEWDGPNLRVTNCDAANEFISKQYREGWKV